MNYQFKRSGRETGGSDLTSSDIRRSDVATEIPGRKVGGEGAIPLLSPIDRVPLSETSGSNVGGAQAIEFAVPLRPVPAAKSSGRKIGAGETTCRTLSNADASPRKISRRKAGASDASRAVIPTAHPHPGDNSGRKVGDEQANVLLPPTVEKPAVQTSGASVSGDEASKRSSPSRVTPHRKSPGREAGADQAIDALPSSDEVPDPQISGSGRGDESHYGVATHVPAALIAELVQLGRARRDWMKTRVGIELRGIAICRRFVAGDKDEAAKLWKAVNEGAAPVDLMFAVGPLLGPIATLREQEKKVDRQMTKLAGTHPLAAWAKDIRGFGHAGLAKVVAECGDVASYRSPACVWKRMGLAVIEGGRQRRVPGAAALDHGYNAERRSVMWNVGGAVIGGMGRGPRPLVGEDMALREDLTPYQRLFVERLRIDAARDPEAHARPHVENKETGLFKESFSAHAANRAKRYVEKRLLKNLWRASRAIERSSKIPDGVPHPADLEFDADEHGASRLDDRDN